jgi:chromosome segregation ATPase
MVSMGRDERRHDDGDSTSARESGNRAAAAAEAAAAAADAAAEVASIVHQQMRTPLPDQSGHLNAVMLSLADIKADQRAMRTDVGLMRNQNEQVLVRLAKGDGRMSLLEQSHTYIKDQLGQIQNDGKEMRNRIERIDRRGGSSDIYHKHENNEGEHSGEGWISAKMVPKIIAAVFGGAVLIVGAFIGGRSTAPVTPAPQQSQATTHTPPGG